LQRQTGHYSETDHLQQLKDEYSAAHAAEDAARKEVLDSIADDNSDSN